MREPFTKDCLRPDPDSTAELTTGQAGAESILGALEEAGKISCIIPENFQVHKFCTLKF